MAYLKHELLIQALQPDSNCTRNLSTNCKLYLLYH